MKKLFGNTGGLKSNHIRKLENLYRRRVAPQDVISPELARDISHLAYRIRRQIGLLINRKGNITHVIIGNHQGIVIPDISHYRIAPGRLRGLRCLHTHLNGEPLSDDDMTDLALLRLDLMAAITMGIDGHPHQVHVSHILPSASKGFPFTTLPPLAPNQTDIGCLDLIRALESELSRSMALLAADHHKERALLVSVTTASKQIALDSLSELKELALSGGIDVLDTILQQRSQIGARYLMGRGKLQELIIAALQKGATAIIFDQELNPSQMRSITDQIDLKVIDRSQLILDIFAQRAQSREGKLQVELAQLKYLLPRLVAKNTAMSRLTGGIGGGGPGETKLEINRRRVHQRIGHLEKSLTLVRKQRKQQRAKRYKKRLPTISIIGYTNVGKSTLLNTLTQSHVLAASRLFATLDPSSRRLRFPRDIEVIITDTVGFIKNLPKDLIAAFRATLEELENADLLLHVIDISNPRFKDQIESVEKILSELQLDHIPAIRVLNKKDLLPPQKVIRFARQYDGIPICAQDKSSLMALIRKTENHISHLKQTSSPPR